MFKMFFCKTAVCVIIAYLVIICDAARILERRVLPLNVVTKATNMKMATQQQARKIFSRVYDEHVEQNRCKQYATGFNEYSFKPQKCICIKFTPSAEGGDYYIDASKLFIQLMVPNDGQTPAVDYLLVCDRRWFY